jgi:F-type H+-transporting ATPase subunit O
LTAAERQKGLQSIVGSSSSPILLNLLNVLSENGRLSSASKVFTDFNSLMAAYRGELEVIVTSAEALDSKSMSRLEKALKGSQLAEGKTLKINNKVCRPTGRQAVTQRVRSLDTRIDNQVNPSLLGGLLVDFGDKTSEYHWFCLTKPGRGRLGAGSDGSDHRTVSSPQPPASFDIT